MSTLYFDDPEQGPAPETSHPLFVRFFPEPIYYSEGDDFSPFGNDDGSDAYHGLVEAFQAEGAQCSAPSYLQILLSEWGFGVPEHMHEQTEPVIQAWLAQGNMHEIFLLSECRARIAVALPELKIAGRISPSLLQDALAAVNCRFILNRWAAQQNPQWPYAQEELQSLRAMQEALQAFVQSSSQQRKGLSK